MKPSLVRGPFTDGVFARRSSWRRCRLMVLTVCVGALMAAPGLADRVVLTNGNVLEGTAELQDNGDVRLSSEIGVLTLRAETVRRVESSQTAENEIRGKLERASGSATEVLELARRALAEGAETLGRRLLQRVLDLDSDHSEARRLLGYVRTELGWELAVDVRRRAQSPRAERLTANDIGILRMLMNAPQAQAQAQAPGTGSACAGLGVTPLLAPGGLIRPSRLHWSAGAEAPARGSVCGSGYPASSALAPRSRHRTSSFRRGGG